MSDNSADSLDHASDVEQALGMQLSLLLGLRHESLQASTARIATTADWEFQQEDLPWASLRV